MSERGSKKHKRSHHQNRYYRSRSSQNEANNYEENINTKSNESDIPGFYFDPIKKKYFKIQSNNFGIESVVTTDSIKNKSNVLEVEKKIKNQLKNRQNLVSILYEQELGANSEQSVKFNDTKIINSSLNHLFSVEANEKIKKICLFKHTQTDYCYLLVNLIHIPYTYRVLKLNSNIFSKINLNGQITHSNVRFVDIDNNNIILSEEYERQSYLPAYIHQEKYLISAYQSTLSTDNKPYKLRLSQFSFPENNQENSLYDCQISLKSFKLPLWCSSVNTDLSMCATGLPHGAEVNGVFDDLSFKLNTRKSDVFCIKFKPDVNIFEFLNDTVLFILNSNFIKKKDYQNQVFAGCKNKFLFGYDLRKNTKDSILELEHGSCLNEILFHTHDPNYIFTNDFTGEVSLWDLRNTKKRLFKYFDNIECNSRCSMYLSDSGSYLYFVPKDGHVRIFNLLTNKIVKTVLSPELRQPNEIYAEIPAIQLVGDLSMIYAINNQFMYYTI